MIAVYCILTCLCGYIAVVGCLQSVKDFHRIIYGIQHQGRKSKPESKEHPRGLKKLQPFIGKNAVSKNGGQEDVDFDNAQAHAKIINHSVQQNRKRVVIAMTGATGAILGIRLLEKLRRLDVETHLVVSKWAEATITYESDYKVREVRALASRVYSARDVAAPISSGSFKVDAMIVVPCSMKTLSSIATGYGDDLISRAADVTFKERRKLILVVRETPLSGIHLHNMMRATENGAIIFPPVPAFYIRPKTVDDVVDQSVGRILDLIDLDTADFERWDGMKSFGGDREKSHLS
ncbi:putative phenylacrylic acid [Phaeomoniella chlamydospora]|uniref:Flavin prenyltransferase PAD1, mitochondrial n=1 Tax=Phaeomoniella chlamydospora TaxID=158046 RepID=A0A0G2ES82_PHACM|nr:putative phenylacrylic acid [Phaeomoniella chlamydospora]